MKCQKKCKLDPYTDTCVGCGRTMQEIQEEGKRKYLQNNTVSDSINTSKQQSDSDASPK